jgi:hypothetical protein
MEEFHDDVIQPNGRTDPKHKLGGDATWGCDFLGILAENLRADYSRFEIFHVYLVGKASRQYL